MKIYHSLDFKSQPERIEPNVAGDYVVHAEDFESLNDLVQRSVLTKTKLPDFSSNFVEYDEENDQSQNTAVETSTGSTEGERSEPAVPPADVSNEPSVTQ